jgi:hypothetical protein
MAERLDQMPRRKVAYPWDEWADGSVWLAVRGEDFTVSVASFSSSVQAYADRAGIKAHCRRVDGDRLAFQFVRPEVPADGSAD